MLVFCVFLFCATLQLQMRVNMSKVMKQKMVYCIVTWLNTLSGHFMKTKIHILDVLYIIIHITLTC